LPSDNPTRRLLDIIENAQAIARYTQGMDGDDLAANSMASDAVERCLARICEAVAKLGDQAAVLLPGQPWHKIRAFGNVLRHDYDDIIRERLWDIIRGDLPPLVAACEATLEKLQKEQ
jgi:uncharacterized protein with HEPN domain